VEQAGGECAAEALLLGMGQGGGGRAAAQQRPVAQIKAKTLVLLANQLSRSSPTAQSGVAESMQEMHKSCG
jgi:hypothetical protein